MKKVFFAVLAAVVAYFGFLKFSEIRGIRAIWQQATDEVKSSE